MQPSKMPQSSIDASKVLNSPDIIFLHILISSARISNNFPIFTFSSRSDLRLSIPSGWSKTFVPGILNEISTMCNYGNVILDNKTTQKFYYYYFTSISNRFCKEDPVPSSGRRSTYKTAPSTNPSPPSPSVTFVSSPPPSSTKISCCMLFAVFCTTYFF